MEPVQEEVIDSFAAVWPQCDGMVYTTGEYGAKDTDSARLDRDHGCR